MKKLLLVSMLALAAGQAEAARPDFWNGGQWTCTIDGSQTKLFVRFDIAKHGKDAYRSYSHLELESLPTGGWGYDHFPASARYADYLGFDFLGQTGKFHTSWGDFGGFKHPDALVYETAQMSALGAKCLVGDQLHPSGRMNRATSAPISKSSVWTRTLTVSPRSPAGRTRSRALPRCLQFAVHASDRRQHAPRLVARRPLRIPDHAA